MNRSLSDGVLTVMVCWLLGAVCVGVGAKERLSPLDLREVRAGGEIGRRVEITLTNNLLKLDADRDFLAPFKKKSAREGFIGLGTLLDAAVKLAAERRDGRAVALKEHLVAEIEALQEPDGYVGMLAPAHRMWGLWDVHEMGYIIRGLVSDYEYFGERRSLETAVKAADYILDRWETMPADWGARTDVAVHVAVTGIEGNLLALYRATGQRRYLDFVVKTRALPAWDLGIVIGRRPGIEGHIYAYLERCLAQLELDRLEPQARLLGQSRRALEFLLHQEGMLITGGAGQSEIWTDDQDGRGDLAETCATAYQVRVYESLLRLEGEARYGDLMERTIYNTLFAAQSPDGQRLRYFSPLEGPRVYFPSDTYCCPCNYRRIIAELPGMIYYRAGRGVAVNLYTASEAKFELEGGPRVRVRQETEYPSSGQVRLRVEPERAARFPVRLRIPLWAKGAKVTVNGAPARGTPRPGRFFELEREWRAGDWVELELPMAWRLVKGRERQAGRVAVARGPLVFCLNPAPNKDLAQLDGADLGYLALDPASLGEPVRNDAVRPGGVGCPVRAFSKGFALGKKGDRELLLTEFPDPEGKATYFRLRDYGAAEEDELDR